MVVGVTLNIVSVHQYKAYLRHRHERDLENNRITYHSSTRTALNVEMVVFATLVIPLPIKSELTPKERRDRKVEKRMFYMALTLCTIVIVSRGLLMIIYSYFFFFSNDTSFQISLALCLVFYSIFTLLPTKWPCLCSTRLTKCFVRNLSGEFLDEHQTNNLNLQNHAAN
jgi:hypothetical protein